ncbi:MAG: hypothetical protein ACXABY_02175 [Candidatus Thorarchaeota archaeon]|jgi:hypothetical protein
MSNNIVVATGLSSIGLPSWGRCFWQDPNDGNLILLYASGNFEVDYVTSADSGVTWSSPSLAFPVDTFSIHNNFDAEMDRAGNVHCVFRYSDSGCYQLLAKDFVGGDWAPSGIGPAGFNRAGDTGRAKGFQGQLMALDQKLVNNPVSDQSQLPHLFIAAKNEDDAIGIYHLNNPYDNVPSGIFMPSAKVPANASGCGVDGGYPFLVDVGPSAGTGKSIKVIFRVQESGHMSIGKATANWGFRYNPHPSGGAAPINFGGFTSTERELEAAGYYSRTLFNDNTTFSRCGDQGNWLTITPNKSYRPELGVQPSGLNSPPWDLMVADYQGFVDGASISDSNFNSSDVFLNLIGTSDYQPLTANTTSHTTVRGIPATGEMRPDNIVVGNRTNVSGTPCDISWRDTPGRVHVYFLDRDSSGKQVISRMMCDVQSAGRFSGDNTRATEFSFSEILAPVSGLRTWAPSDMALTGGSGNSFAWNNFKILRHPVDQGSGVFKQEIVITEGLSHTGIYSLAAWDYDKSIDAQFSFNPPVYAAERTAVTGAGTSFLSISAQGFDPAPAFDGDMTTSTNISASDTLTLGFDKPLPFSRVEFAWRAPTFGGKRLPSVVIESSYDGVTFQQVGAIPSGISIEPSNFASPQPTYPDRLVKAGAEVEHGFNDTTLSTGLIPFIGQFVRFKFVDTSSTANNVPVYGIRLYGPSQTPSKWVTTGFEKDLVAAKATESSVEQFNSVFEFSSLPPGWRATGDWDWFVRASGDLSKPNGLPTSQPTQNGIIASGIFAGLPVGSGDGSALRTAEWMPLNSSGVVEVDISIAATEIDSSGAPGRNISWDTRYHKIGQGLIIPASAQDDEFSFYIAPTGASASTNMGEVKGFFTQGPCFVGTCNYFTVSTNVPPGDWTLRWVFKRGNTANNIPIAGDESVAYIDNVRGLDGPPVTTIFGYMRAESFATGVVHGYLKKASWSAVNAYTRGYFWFEPRHGYIEGGANALGNVHGYLLGNKEGQVYGFAMGGSGLLSIPSGSINSYMMVQSGTISATNAYVHGMNKGEVLGYLPAFSGFAPASGIYGYMMVPDVAEQIYGGVNMGVSGTPMEQVYGFLANREFESVQGFVAAPPGATSMVFGYIPPQPSGNIHGYARGLSSATGSIFTFVKVADAEGNIYGYMPASGTDIIPGDQQRVFGYLLNDGVAEQINGYMNVIDTEEVYGYMKGNAFASGGIHAWTSGIGFGDSSINGYLAGISGNASGSINGYMIGVEIPSSATHGYLVGFDPSDTCGSHGTVPIPPAIIVAIPSGVFINNC